MNIIKAVKRACEEPTLLDALSWICVWESERAIKQAYEYAISNKRTHDGAGWEICFKHCIKLVMESYKLKGDQK